MTRGRPGRAKLGRRAALALPFGLTACSLFDDWFSENKPRLPGKREPVLSARRSLRADENGPAPRVSVPAASENANWPQAGGNPAHVMQHLAGAPTLSRIWRTSIGAGGGYRDKLLAQPVAAGGVVYTMDADAVVSAIDLTTGARRWRADSKGKDDESTNVGGGLAVEGDTLYAVNGLAELVAFDAAHGTERWRRSIAAPARSAPLAAQGRLFVVTIQDKLLALSATDGAQVWSHQATGAPAALLGQPAPAYADGIVVAGFGSGELAALRVDTGTVAWTDSVASIRGGRAGSEISSIRGLPAISEGRVFAIGLGGLLLAIDLRSGRRLWERDVAGEDSPWVAGDWMFLISSEQQLASVRLQDGRVAWVSDLPRWENEEKEEDPILWFGPVLVGGRLIAVGTNGQIIAADPTNGATVASQRLGGEAALGPIVVDQALLTLTNRGELAAFR